MLRLHDYWRSSASYRVRIALNIKGLTYETLPVDLRRGAQRETGFLAVNPQGLVPVLEDGATSIAQSVAILEYLEETHPAPALLPRSASERAQVRSLVAAIACDIHPLNNLRVTNYLRERLSQGEEAINDWIRHWIVLGFEALEVRAAAGGSGRFLHGDALSLADVCLVPQMYNARRFECDLAPFPTLVAIDAALAQLPAVAAARPVDVDVESGKIR